MREFIYARLAGTWSPFGVCIWTSILDVARPYIRHNVLRRGDVIVDDSCQELGRWWPIHILRTPRGWDADEIRDGYTRIYSRPGLVCY